MSRSNIEHHCRPCGCLSKKRTPTAPLMPAHRTEPRRRRVRNPSTDSRGGTLPTTTIHGLQDLLSSKRRTTKAAWTLVLAVIGLFLLYSIAKTSITYYRSPLITSLTTKFAEEFPEMMYCPIGLAVSAEMMDQLKLTWNDVIFLNHYFPQYSSLHRGFNYQEIIRQQTIAKHIQNANISLPRFFWHLGSSYDITIIGAQNYTVELTVNHQGVCYLINIRDPASRGHFSSNKQISMPSSAHLYAGNSENPDPPIIHTPYSFGALYFGEDVHSILPQAPTYIRDGYENVVVVKETRWRFHDTYFAKCHHKTTYELTNTVVKCYHNFTWAHMNCTYVASLTDAESGEQARLDDYCHTITTPLHLGARLAFKHCVDSIVGNVISCNHRHFDVAVRDMASTGRRTIVNFRRVPDVLYIEECEVYTWQGYLSNVGGLFSLFCGASLISLIQAAFHGLKFLGQRCCYRRKSLGSNRCRKDICHSRLETVNHQTLTNGEVGAADSAWFYNSTCLQES